MMMMMVVVVVAVVVVVIMVRNADDVGLREALRTSVWPTQKGLIMPLL